jgi:hypothetical protein
MINNKDKKKIEEMDELTSYFFIDMIGGILWRTAHDASHGRFDITPEMQEELDNIREQQVYCVQQLSKFGIDPESAKNRPDGDYWKWFTHWDNWKKGLSDSDWDEVNHLMSEKQSMDKYLPKNKWNEKPVE